MQDRIPVNPGRVLISPENGSPYYATMTRADNPTQEGTPLNKNSLLRDDTAALFGLGADAVPDEVFGVLSRFQNSLGNEYVWEKTKSRFVEKLYAQSTGYPYYITSALPVDMPYSDSIGFNDDGSVYLVNPSTYRITTSNYATAASFLSGKYIDTTNTTDYATPTPGITKLPANSVFKNSKSLLWLQNYSDDPSIAIFVDSEMATIVYGYVNSPNPNAYPIDDGYTYKALGQLGNKAQIATGSYTGTGTYGASNPNRLTFDFEPKLVIVKQAADSFLDLVMIRGCTSERTNDSGAGANTVTWTENGVEWYLASGTSPQYQMNYSYSYVYIAIG